ncbi:VHAA2 [Hepatospora eriocheir]|uniref:V-type proton ATPase subunit a n=1 Tax=Hepatospora eriocheir TaxID=1081669 RepID=A0A1X0QIK6_9MICR|nr:VHAA2 [Hepatospora eriocheir]
MIKSVIETVLKKNCYIELVDVDFETTEKQQSIILAYSFGDISNRKIIEIINTMGGKSFSSTEFIEDTTNEKYFMNLIKESKEVDEERKSLKQLEEKLKILKKEIGENFATWKSVLYRERMIYETLNKINKSTDETYTDINNMINESFTGECWVRKKDFDQLNNLISSNKDLKFYYEEIKLKPNEVYPTAFTNNEFMESFQNLTNVFGVPKYKEINPAIFLVFTFPFMFGSMFGDIFHGLILLFVSLFMIKNFDKLNNNCGVLQILLEGRFIILLCSFGAIWFGLLYTDFASLSFSLFNSTTSNYPIGINPIWHHSANSMAFTNNLKMKLSLIIGFIHMELGCLISIANSILSNNRIDLFCTVIPQVLAFTLFLGYLVFLCIYKWLVTVNHPSLVGVLIGMYTEPFTITDQMYPGQLYVQLFIVSIIIASIPWMLFSKPIYILLKGRSNSDQMLDTWINSGIHTIEFSLGLISNTSSYLRIWAVSLAHNQLTSVIHQFTIGANSFVKKIVLFPVYLTATLLILIGLEGLSACLHALRLNWIEFFGKFYKGEGVMFEPLNFKLSHEELYDL